MSDTFTKDDGDFSLEDWIDGARLPEKAATVYGRADLVAELHELEQRLHDARATDSNDERLAGPSPSTIAAKIEKTRELMQKSALTFRFRALLNDEITATKKAHKGDDEALTYALLSVQAVHPKVAPEQWAKIKERIGEGQFAALLEAAGSASNDRRVSVPFSLAASAYLSSEDS